MSGFYKILCVMISALLLMGLFTGCRKTDDTDSPETTTAATTTTPKAETTEPPVLYESIEDLTRSEHIVSVTEIPDVGHDALAYEIIFLSGALQIQADIVLPKDYQATSYHMVYYVPEVKTSPSALASRFAAHHLAVVCLYERGMGKSEGARDFGGTDYEDVVSIAQILSEMPFFAASKQILAGSSSGSILALRAAAESDLFDGCAVIDVISDLVAFSEARGDQIKNMFSSAIGKTSAEAPEEYQKRSAVVFADRIDVSVLLMQYRNTPFFPEEQVTMLHEKLKALGKTSELYYIDEISSDFNAIACEKLYEWIKLVP